MGGVRLGVKWQQCGGMAVRRWCNMLQYCVRCPAPDPALTGMAPAAFKASTPPRPGSPATLLSTQQASRCSPWWWPCRAGQGQADGAGRQGRQPHETG
jgi:hypothetical protein